MRVKGYFLIILLALVVDPQRSFAGGFRVAFEDHFDGEVLDREKWATRYVYADGTLASLKDEQQDYADSANHVIADGVLSLIARPRPSSERYESGMIRSRQTFYYGYFEARVLLPDARGTWPAFWLNSDYDADGRLNWPPEIDAFEYVINETHETPDMIHSSVKVGKDGVQGGEWLYRDPAFDKRWTYYRAAKPLNTSWQVIGLLWKPDSVSMYLNGRKIYTRSYRWVYDNGELAGPAHVLLNLAVGGRWAGLNGVDRAKFPQALKIDYVRVCQYAANLNAHDRCADNPLAPPASEAAYSTSGGDLPRTMLVSAEIASIELRAGEMLDIRYAFDAVATRKNHEIRTTLVDDRGAEVFSVASQPSVPSSSWRGRQIVSLATPLPRNISSGHYRVVVAIGSKDGENRGRALHVPFAAHRRYGVPDGRRRYSVGELSILAEKSKQP